MAVAVQRPRERGGVAPEVGRALDLAARLGDRLAGLQRLGQGDALAVAVDQIGDAAGAAPRAPCRRGATSARRRRLRRAAAIAASASAAPPLAATVTSVPCAGERRSKRGAVGAVAPGAVDQVPRPEGLGRQRRRRWRRSASGRAVMVIPPGKSGLRLARKAATPSALSALAAIMPPPSASISAARSSPTAAWISYFATSTARGDSAGDALGDRARRARARPRPPRRRTERQRPLAGMPPPEQRHLLDHRLGQQPRQPLRARPARHDPDPASGSASVAFGAITRMSQAAASSSPPPKAWPEIAATVGLQSRASRSKIRWPSRTQWRAKSAGASFAPGDDVRAGAEGPLALGVTITARTSGSRSSAAQCASSASSIGTVSAFSLAGLSSRSSAMAPSTDQVQRAHRPPSPHRAPGDRSDRRHRRCGVVGQRVDRGRREASRRCPARVDARHDLGRDEPVAAQPDHAALGDVEHLLPGSRARRPGEGHVLDRVDHLGELAGLRDPQRVPGQLELAPRPRTARRRRSSSHAP